MIKDSLNLKISETKGDVSFYTDSNGNMYQKIKDEEIFKVKNGSIAYRLIKQINGYKIKYNVNGIWGFSIWKDDINLEDGFWTIAKAEEMAALM